MTNTLSKQFIQLCDAKYIPIGFGRKKQTYARIVNDVVQVFSLKISHWNSVCTIAFGVFPLCMNISSLDICNYTIDKFDICAYAANNGWHYCRYSKQSISDCLFSILQLIDNELMPFFGRANCCNTALPELIRLDGIFEENRIAVLKLLGENNSALPWQEISLEAPEKYHMALKSHNFLYARAYLQYQINNCKKVLSGMESDTKQPQIVGERYAQRLDGLEAKLRALDEEGANFDEEIMTQEQETRAELIAKYPFLNKA